MVAWPSGECCTYTVVLRVPPWGSSAPQPNALETQGCNGSSDDPRIPFGILFPITRKTLHVFCQMSQWSYQVKRNGTPCLYFIQPFVSPLRTGGVSLCVFNTWLFNIACRILFKIKNVFNMDRPPFLPNL